MGKKQETTREFNSTTMPINPQPVTDAITGIAGTLNNLAGIDPYSLVPGTNPFHDMAGEAIGGLDDVTNSFLRNPMWNDFMKSGPSLANSINAKGLIEGFENPYTQSVVDSTLAQFDETANQERTANLLRGSKSNAFSSSGGGIFQALSDRFTDQNRGTLEGTLRNQGFAQALQAALQQAGQDTQVSMQNAQQSNAYRLAQMDSLLNRTALLGSEGRANAALQGDFGNMMRGIEQQEAMSPFTAAQLRAGIAGSTPFGITRGEETQGHEKSTSRTSDPLGTIGSLAMLAAAPFTGGASLLGGLGALGGAGSLSAGLAGFAPGFLGGMNPAVAGMGLAGLGRG